MTIRENPYAVNEINIFADMHIIMLILIPLMAPPIDAILQFDQTLPVSNHDRKVNCGLSLDPTRGGSMHVF